MVESYSQRIFAGQRPVFDGRKNMYSREPLPIGRDKVCLYVRQTRIHCVIISQQTEFICLSKFHTIILPHTDHHCILTIINTEWCVYIPGTRPVLL